MMDEEAAEDSPFASFGSQPAHPGARFFTRHATCLPRLEHSSSLFNPSSPESDDGGFGVLGKMDKKPPILSKPAMNARIAVAKPPRLPFPTSKSGGGISHWNQRGNSIPAPSFKPLVKPTLKIAASGLEDFSRNVAGSSNSFPIKKRDRSHEMDVDTQEIVASPARSRSTSSAVGLTAEPLVQSLPRITPAIVDSPPLEKIRKTMDLDCAESGPEHLLPCFQKCSDALKRITPETLADVLDGKYAGHLEDFLIIDCRYPFEYAGGHIRGARNVNTTGVLEAFFFPVPMQQPRVVVFHCEFSIQRAPMMGLHLRNHDRNTNMSTYPHLDYPHVYILEGGYKGFFSKFQNHCSPSGYTPMNDPMYSEELRKYTQMHKKEFKRCYSTGFLRT
ncbi:UNVERIFIED_CONTAM: cell division cycle- protein [Siphonaria sp. JEL0065]|nr:cell division cycle- protein [Siphonaria sp. JEL0065]